MHPLTRIAALTAALALMPAAGADDAIYKWVDDAGVTQYTQQPPMDRDAQRLESGRATGPSASPPTRSTEPAPSARETDREADEDYPASVAEYCEQMREQADTLASDAPVQLRGDDGSLQMIDGEDRAQRLEQARSQIAEHCDDAAG